MLVHTLPLHLYGWIRAGRRRELRLRTGLASGAPHAEKEVNVADGQELRYPERTGGHVCPTDGSEWSIRADERGGYRDRVPSPKARATVTGMLVRIEEGSGRQVASGISRKSGWHEVECCLTAKACDRRGDDRMTETSRKRVIASRRSGAGRGSRLWTNETDYRADARALYWFTAAQSGSALADPAD